jgi:hypothetical protein
VEVPEHGSPSDDSPSAALEHVDATRAREHHGDEEREAEDEPEAEGEETVELSGALSARQPHREGACVRTPRGARMARSSPTASRESGLAPCRATPCASPSYSLIDGEEQARESSESHDADGARPAMQNISSRRERRPRLQGRGISSGAAHEADADEREEGEEEHADEHEEIDCGEAISSLCVPLLFLWSLSLSLSLSALPLSVHRGTTHCCLALLDGCSVGGWVVVVFLRKRGF